MFCPDGKSSGLSTFSCTEVLRKCIIFGSFLGWSLHPFTRYLAQILTGSI